MVALGHLCRYQAWRGQPEGERVRFREVDDGAGRRIVESALQTPSAPDASGTEGGWLNPAQTRALLTAYGLPATPPETAADAAPSGANAGPGLEMVLGIQPNPSFGPVIMAGLGGLHQEIFQDFQFSLHPLTGRDAERMLDQLRVVHIPRRRGKQPAWDLPAVKECLLRLSQLVEDIPHIAEITLSPLRVAALGQGCHWSGARVRVANISPWQDFNLRHLDD